MSRLSRALLLLFAAACPAPSPAIEDAGSTQIEVISPVEMCNRIAQVRCELLDRCYPAFQRDVPASCRSLEQARCLADYEALRPSFDADVVEVDTAQVVSCEERMRTSQCAPTFPPGYPSVAVHPFSDCELETGLLRGKVSTGESCSHSVDCVPGSVCIKPGGVCRGICATTPRVGEPCSFGCERGLYCDDRGSEDTADDRCTAPKGVDAPCEDSRECGPTLYCLGTCRPRGKLGESCVFDATRLSTCDPGLACDVAPYASGATGTCRIPAAIGALCNYHWSCAPGLLCFDLGYEGFPTQAPIGGVCQRPGPVGSNCPYTPYASLVGDQCGGGTYCTRAQRCEAVPALGEACTPSSQSCAGVGAYCKPSGSGDTGTCSAAANPGERCAFSIDATRTVTIPCSAGFCDTESTFSCLAPNKQLGEACQSDGQCVSNRCAVQQDRSLRCASSCS